MGVLEGLEDVIECLSTGPISLERSTGSGYDTEGNPVRGRKAISTLSPAVVHIASGRELMRLPEGDRTREVLLILTQVRLRTARVASGKEADIVHYRSQSGEARRYVVKVSEDWESASGHYRCLAVMREGS